MRSIVKKSDIFIAPLLVGAALLIIYCIKSVYPFGSNSVSYFDLAQSFVPMYTRTWDVYHGYKSAFMDWNVGLVANHTDLLGTYILFPLNYILYFAKRNSILDFMSYFLLIKLMLTSLTMSIYIKHKFNSGLYCIFAGILYASSGFVIQYYTNLYFLDTVIMLPILMLGVEKLINEGKRFLYIISLFLLSLTGIQIVFMVLVYLFIKVFFMLRESENKYANSCKFMISSLAGIGLAGFAIVPALYTLFSSTRSDMNASGTLFDFLLTVFCDFQEQKNFMLYGGEIGIAAIVIIFLSGKEYIKKYFSRMFVILLLMIPILVDSINNIWHGGSYICFPMRFGFILSFELLCLGGDVFFDSNKKEFKIGQLLMLFGFAMIPLALILLLKFFSFFTACGIRELSSYSSYGLIMIIILLFYFLIFLGKSSRSSLIICIIMAVIQMGLGYYGLIAPTEAYSLECDDRYISKTFETFSGQVSDDKLDRVKDINNSLNANYGLFAGVSTVSEFVNGVNSAVPKVIGKLGYTTNSIRMMDQGGTLISDAFLGIKKVYCDSEPNDDLYGSIEEDESGKLYRCRYTMPAGIVYNTDYFSKLSAGSREFDYQNALYKDLCRTDKDLINIIDCYDDRWEKENIDGDDVYSIELDTEGDSVVYISCDYDDLNQNIIYINDEIQKIPYLEYYDNIVYPVGFCNGIVEAGSYHDEKVKIGILPNRGSIEGVRIGILSLGLLQEGIESAKESAERTISYGKDSMEIIVDSKDDGKFVLPIGYSENWSVSVDGEIVHPYGTFDGAFIAMNVTKGKHTIEIKFVPKGLYIGIICTVIGLVLLMLCIVLEKKKMELPINRIVAIPYRLYKIIYIDFLILIYLVPIAFYIFVVIITHRIM